MASLFTISLTFLLLTQYPEHHLKCLWEDLMRLWRISMEIFRRQTSFGNFKICFLCQGTTLMFRIFLKKKNKHEKQDQIPFENISKLFSIEFFYHFIFNLNSDISGIWYQCIFSSQTIFSNIINFYFWFLWAAWWGAGGDVGGWDKGEMIHEAAVWRSW